MSINSKKERLMKTMIIGYSGSGKSTLAKTIADKEGVPSLFLDTVHWLPGWKERPREEEIKIVCDFLDGNAAWVIDGNYGSVLYERRCQEADRIIFLNIGRFTCLRRAIKRYRTHKGKSRFSMTDGCPEKIDREFLLWLLFKGRDKKHRDRYKRTVSEYGDKLIEIKSLRQLEKFYRQLSEQ